MSRLYAGATFFALEHAADVLKAWTELPAAAIDDLTRIGMPGSSARAGAAPPHALRARTPRARSGKRAPRCPAKLPGSPSAWCPPALEAQLEGLLAAVARHRSVDYPNFVEQPADASAFFHPNTWTRLRPVEADYDPQDVFKSNHPIPPAESR